MKRNGRAEVTRIGGSRAVVSNIRAFDSGRPKLRDRLGAFLGAESLARLLLAFVLATALWLYVNSRFPPGAALAFPQPIPVSAENVPPGLTVRNIIHSVHVNVRPAVAGLGFPASDFVATVDLHGFHAGLHKRIPVHLSWDPSVPVVSYSPHTVAVDLERVVSKTVPVEIHVVGAPPYGYALKQGSLYASPGTVKVSGPKSFMAQVDRSIVDVSLDTARSSINVSVTPTLENAQGRPLPKGGSMSPQRVRIHAVIQQLASYKTLPILATIRGEPSTGFGVTSIQVNPPGLTAYGSPHALNKIRNLRTAPVDVRGLKAGKRTLRVRLRKPAGVFTPTKFRQVRVTVTVGPVTGAASTRVVLHPVGVGAGDGTRVSPDSVLVTFSGPSPVLGASGRALKAVVDVSGLTPGSYSLRPHIEVPKGVTVDSVQPQIVAVTVRVGG